jgi:membrane-associated phospholipid phosphatase
MIEHFFSHPVLFSEGFLNSVHIIGTPWFDTMMILITTMGDYFFSCALLTILLWCYDYRLTIQLLILFLVANMFTDGAKHFFAHPRPELSLLLPEISALAEVQSPSSYGFPSGHALEAIIIWGGAACFLNKRFLLVVAPLAVILISYSRLYLGVHYAGDVAGGLVMGILLLGIGVTAAQWLHKISSLSLVIVGAGAAILCLLAALWVPGTYITTSGGVCSGCIIGALVYSFSRSPHTRTRRPLPFQVITVAIGWGVIILVALVQDPVGPGDTGRMFQGFITGLWVTAGAPPLFSWMSSRWGISTPQSF